MGLLFYNNLEPAKRIGSAALLDVSWICFWLTILIALFPWEAYRFILRHS